MFLSRHIKEGKNTTGKKPKPDWLKKLDEGNEFNRVRSKEYPYNEVYINKDGKYVRLDSYNPVKGEIVSRKHTQLSDIQESTAKSYIKELETKYPPGSKIADVPSNKTGGNSGILKTGDTIKGKMVLEVPVQNKPVPKAVVDAADNADIIIRDTNGKIY